MRTMRFALTCAVLFVFAIVWNGTLHLVILAHANATIAHLRRADQGQSLLLSLFLVASLCVLFTYGYVRFARTGTLREGLGYGLFMAVLAGLLVDFNQYLIYPIPGSLAIKWFLGGVVEFSLYGLIVASLCRRLVSQAPKPNPR